MSRPQPTGHPRNAAAGPPSTSTMSRAERFEDEKRRIIESCFSKYDGNGQLAESYITHIRIVEDALNPSAPSPADTGMENKKPRLIIVAVRSTGRVRMHKARENNNGSFSIGKTWNLEELSAIETFSGVGIPPPASERDQKYREWAGNVGFTVTLTKPYYWQAGTAKEKDFFIASCVKIYKKYTNGLTPELRGFGEQERSALSNHPPNPQQDSRRQHGAPNAAGQGSSDLRPPQPQFARERTGSRESSPLRSPGPSPGLGEQRRPSDSPARGPRGPPSGGLGVPPGPRPYTSQEQIRPSPNSFNSREAPPPSLRPGTAPGPRQPPSQQSRGPPPPPFNRDGSPGVASFSSNHSSGSAPGPGQPMRQYQRQPSYPDPQRQPPLQGQNGEVQSPTAANAFHASLYGQQRLDDSHPPSQPPSRPPTQPLPPHPQQQRPSQGNGVPKQPPVDTGDNWPLSQERKHPSRQNTASESEPSSGALDLGDAAAINALTGFWGPDSGSAVSQSTPKPTELVSPPTPERSSRRRPALDEQSKSSDSSDLRPAPLGPAKNRVVSGEQNSQVSAQTSTVQPRPPPSPTLSSESGQPTPRPDQFNFDDNAPKPLFQRNHPSQPEADPHVPGAFATPPLGDSPFATPNNEHVRPLTSHSTSSTLQQEPKVRPLSPTPSQAKQDSRIETGAESISDSKSIASTIERPDTGTSETDVPPAEQFRPGLGPMIKKTTADRFRNAARAANAFKPRPGGAAAKILQAKAEREANGGADGISGVFKPQPKLEEPQSLSAEPTTLAQPSETQSPNLSVKTPALNAADTPVVQVHGPLSPVNGGHGSVFGEDSGVKEGVQLTDPSPASLQPEVPSSKSNSGETGLEERPLRTPQGKVKRRSVQQERYLAELGVDRTLLEGKGIDFEILLSDFGWSASTTKPRNVVELEADIKREVGRIEAGAWLSPSESQRDEKVAQVESLLDRCIAECDELDGLLTLYSVELGTLTEDIAFIEAQSQGLQVQSANQKLLHNELSALLQTTNLDRRILDPLRHGDLSDEGGLETVEHNLIKLYQAMITMDPTLRNGGIFNGRPASKSGNISADTELAQMKALREKRAMYQRECNAFCDRLMQHLDSTFATAFNGLKDRALRPPSSAGGAPPAVKKLDRSAFGSARAVCWVYSPLILFAKEINLPVWGTLLKTYHSRARPLYENVFKENIAGWKRSARRPTGEEAEILFTHQERETAEAAAGSSGLSSTARKLTVKRSQTLAKTLRQASGGEKHSADIVRSAGTVMSSVIFASIMDEMAPLVSQEQNFVVDLFHATSLETSDFPDAVHAHPPHERRGTNLMAGRHVEPDREMALHVSSTTNEIFGFFTTELSQLLDWALSMDPLQGVGVMASLSKHAFYLQQFSQSQEWLISTIDVLATRLQTLFSKFVEEQIRAIEDTKVKIKKRKGVIGFMKVFPHFSAAIENIFSTVAGDDYEKNHSSIHDVRRLIDDAYARINGAMFDSLKVIAKETPATQQLGGVPAAAGQKIGQSDDPEDKATLNYQILIIENMNHYLEEVEDGGRSGSVLAEWREQAQKERKEALNAYVNRVIRRPLGKILDWLDTADSLLHTSTSDTSLTSRQNYTRKAARNLLAQHDGKEIRRGIDTLRKRIEKHFGDADEEAISRTLVTMVCKECEAAYGTTLERLEALKRDQYPPVDGEKNVDIAFDRSDIQAGFRR